MEPFYFFEESIFFYKKNSFEIFDYKDINDFFQRFKKRIEYQFRQNINSFDVDHLKNLIFEYLGFDTRYGLNYPFTSPACRQIWSYWPYVEDEYENQFLFINSHLNRVLEQDLPVKYLTHKTEHIECSLSFLYNDELISIKEENVALLSCKYILTINEMVRKDKNTNNLYILDYDSYESIIFTCSEKVLTELLIFLNIDSSRIK